MNISARRRRLSGQEFTNEAFTRADLRSGLAWGSRWRNCVFLKCEMGQADFRDSSFENCDFYECDMGQAILVGRFDRCTFTNCDLGQATLIAAYINGCSFSRCRMDYAQLSRATLIDSAITDSNLHGSVCDFAYTHKVDFTGSNLWGVVFPVSCAFVAGNTFDERQVDYFLSLILHAELPAWTRRKLELIVDERRRKVVDRLVAGQRAGEESPEGVASGGRESPAVVVEVAPIGDGLRAPDGDNRAADH